MIKLLYVLGKIGQLTPNGLYRLFSSIYRHGINLMALLSFAQKAYGKRTALIDDNETISYNELFVQSQRLSVLLKEKFQIEKGKKVAFLCKNSASLVKSIFAVSQSGADMVLLNAQMSQNQLNQLNNHYNFDFLIVDDSLFTLAEQSGFCGNQMLCLSDALFAGLMDMDRYPKTKPRRVSLGRIVILTGGTTGKYKTAIHKPSLMNFLNPYRAMLTRLKLANCKTAYIATPIYHGYGFAVLFLLVSLGAKIMITRSFNTEKACRLVREHQVEAIFVVPLMIYRMLQYHADDLMSLRCIASGGAELNPRFVRDIIGKLGDVLYNLYGTSEAGLNIVATPDDLKYSPTTIGKEIDGVHMRILDKNLKNAGINNVGTICIKNKWSMKNTKMAWIETGDLGYRDQKGYLFLCGRKDDMIVSAGENVYPAEVEQILLNHPQIDDAAVIAVKDESYGQRLKAFVVLEKDCIRTTDEICEWLRTRAARFQMPREIVILDEMPYTPLGKLDRKQLR